MINKKALILANVGTPNAPTTRDTRRYLSEFLNDPLVIDLSPAARSLLVNLIIVPFRSPRSAAKYRKLWTEKGSPLLVHMEELVSRLRKMVPADTDVFGLMRYGNPSLEEFLKNLRTDNYDQVTIFPLYPQYATSTTGSIEALAGKLATGKVNLIRSYHAHPAFVHALVTRVEEYNPDAYDHVLFSYHGLPNRQVQKSHPQYPLEGCRCENEMPAHGSGCYRAACYETSRLLAGRLGLEAGRFSTSFQSRLSRNWMKPFTDHTIEELAAAQQGSLLVVPASFTADCLETTLEIDQEYRELFIRAGGKEFTMTASLNASQAWTETILEIAAISSGN